MSQNLAARLPTEYRPDDNTLKSASAGQDRFTFARREIANRNPSHSLSQSTCIVRRDLQSDSRVYAVLWAIESCAAGPGHEDGVPRYLLEVSFVKSYWTLDTERSVIRLWRAEGVEPDGWASLWGEKRMLRSSLRVFSTFPIRFESWRFGYVSPSRR